MKAFLQTAAASLLADIALCRACAAAYPVVPDSLLLLWVFAVFRCAILFGAAQLFRRSGDGYISGVQLFLYFSVLSSVPPAYSTLKSVFFSETWLVTFSPFSWSNLLFTYLTSVLAVLLWRTILYVIQAPTNEVISNVPENEKEKEKNGATIRRLLSYSKYDIVPMSGAFFFLAMAVIGEMFLPHYTGKVIDILSTTYDHTAFLNAIFFLCLTSVGSSFAAGCRGGLFMFSTCRLSKRIQNLLFKTLVQQDIEFFERTHTGKITSRLSNDTSLMSRSIALNVNVLLRSLIKTVGIYWFMFKLSWQLTLLSAIESPVTILMEKAYNKYYQNLVKHVQESIAKSSEAAGEIISSIRTVRSFATEEEETQRYKAKLHETHVLKTKRDTIRAIYLLFRRLFQLTMHILIMHYGRNQVISGNMTTGSLVSFILYQMDAGTYIQTLVVIHVHLLQSAGAAEKVFEYLDRQPTVKTDGTLNPSTLKGHVQFRNVNFSYPTRPEIPVLKNISFDLKPGSITAIVGSSGGGKSTCVSLLERFYDPQSGDILLDGQPIHKYCHKFLHTKIALVGQEPVLFARSLRENISYGLPNCTLKQVISAAQQSSAHNFIESMEDGYETDAGEKGGQLSGGQKQRIAIARALMRKPQVLVLDEATSSLDIESEQMIQQELYQNQQRTVLIIAHRLKTVENADKIIVIEDGAVAEEGTHKELMEKEGYYYRLVQRLFSENNQEQ